MQYMDASGSVVMHTGTDCDDTSAGLNGLDVDSDGFTSCADANGLSDCDDSDANTYPGIAVNEDLMIPMISVPTTVRPMPTVMDMLLRQPTVVTPLK